MNTSDMCDVLHYFFEEDSYFISETQSDTRTALRENMYGSMYNQKYLYGIKSSRPSTETTFGGELDGFEGLDPLDPNKNVLKPYIPPTEMSDNIFDPFGGVLDAPIN